MPGTPARFPRVAIVGRPGTPDLDGPLGRLARFLASKGHAVVLEADTARQTSLAGYGVAGLAAMAAMARPLDHWPKASVLACLAALAGALVALTTLAFGGSGGLTAALVGVAAVVLWGAASTALPPMLQASAMRTSPEDPDGASGRYVAAFQVGIMAGSLSGGVIYDNAGLAVMIATSAALIIVAMVGVLATRSVFGVASATGER